MNLSSIAVLSARKRFTKKLSEGFLTIVISFTSVLIGFLIVFIGDRGGAKLSSTLRSHSSKAIGAPEAVKAQQGVEFKAQQSNQELEEVSIKHLELKEAEIRQHQLELEQLEGSVEEYEEFAKKHNLPKQLPFSVEAIKEAIRSKYQNE